VDGDRLLLLGTSDRIIRARDLGLELLPGPQDLTPLVVERRRELVGQPAELLAVGVPRQHRELRLGSPQRQLLALELDARGQDRVLQRVLAGGELA